MSYKPKYETPEELEAAAEKYFEYCDDKGDFYTVAGLAHFLGFKSRKALSQIKSIKPEFEYVIDRTKLKMEENASQNLLKSSKNISGTIFYLKNCFGWKDMEQKDIHIHGSIQAMTDEQLDERLKLALRELIREIGMDGLKQLGFDGESKSKQEGEQENGSND